MLRTYGLGDVADLQFPDIWLQSTGVKELERGLQEVQSSPGNASCKLVFLLLAKKDIQTYQAFKALADRHFGIHSICITEAANIENVHPKVNRDNQVEVPAGTPWIKYQIRQYFGNVMMKVNLKMGGINHSTAFVRQKMQKTLVLGVIRYQSSQDLVLTRTTG
jgi:eukaryotic translation initiation factor 2C